MYFKNFNKIYYSLPNSDGTEELIVLTDITKNIRFRKEVLSNITLYDEYDIRDGETPEILAEKFYGNPEYHWIIMLANERYDYINDFPLSTYDLEQYIKSKYGFDNSKIYSIHHYEANGYVVNSDYPNAVPVSNYDYETRENEKKRRIKIISKSTINLILQNFASL
jgi:hypothetical protein